MKYRYRPSDKSHPPRFRRALHLSGSKTLRKGSPNGFYPLRDPEPYIERSGDPKKVKRIGRLRILFQRLGTRITRLRDRKRREAPHKTLPVLAGALTGALTVTLSVALIGLFVLAAPYGRSYTAVTVPDFEGKDPFSVLREEDPFNLILRYEANPLVAEGLVISQSPPAGVRRRIYSQDERCNVVLTVSRKTEPYSLEVLSGYAVRDAELLLLNHGIRVSLEEEYSSLESGTVLGSLPEAGTPMQTGDTVTLRISRGKKPMRTYVPDLSGLSESEALARLTKAGLRSGAVSYRTSSLPAGTVVEQELAAHTMADAYSEIGFCVSLGDRYAIRSVPDLYGMSDTDAEITLRGYGLTVTKRHPIPNPAEAGTVITQSPLPGTPITAETIGVELYVSSPSD